MIYRGGVPVVGFGSKDERLFADYEIVSTPLTAAAFLASAPAADPYAPASLLYSQLLARIYQAKDLVVAGQYAQAIQTFQSIGNEAAATLGPAIDKGPLPSVTSTWTGDAWTLNGQKLAPIRVANNGSDAQAASTVIDAMMYDYSAAIDKAHAAMGIAPSIRQGAVWPYVSFAGAVIAAAGTATYLLVRR